VVCSDGDPCSAAPRDGMNKPTDEKQPDLVDEYFRPFEIFLPVI
jgi:hypothetical protein